MTSQPGRSKLWRARVTVLLLALIPAVLFVLLVSDGQPASAQTPIARAWGINSFGQLGDDSFAPRSKQVEVKGEGGTGTLGNVTSLEGGQNHTLALKNGTVYAWGHNGSGQLGTGPLSGTGTDSDVPVQVHGAGDVGFLTDVMAIAAGGNFSLALVSDGPVDGVANDGTMWAWGNNNRGQIGDGTSGVSAQRNTPVQVSNENGAGFLTGVTDIAAGAEQSLAAVSPHGTVWAWGHNDFGSLGNGSFGGNFSRPVQAIQPIGATQVAAGDFHSLAVADADTTAPDTTIDSGPDHTTKSAQASFVFSSAATDLAGFECRRDTELFASCSSPKGYLGLSEGSHTFHATARDIAGNPDPIPASYTWTVVTVAPPAPSITSPNDNSYDNDGNLDVSGTAEANSAVKILEGTTIVGTTTADGSGDWSKGIVGVSAGPHTYKATATDAATNTSLESSAVTVTVDLTDPTLDTDNSDGSDGVTPNNAARNVPRRTNVKATFTENFEMDAATLVTNSTVQAPEAYTLVNKKTGATVSCDDPCLTVTLDPSGKLARRTPYRATITTAATDAAGNPLDAEKSWTFKTRRM